MLPMKTVVTTTRVRDVVTMTGLWVTDLSILNTNPNATAPLIEPAYAINSKSLSLTPGLYPNILK